MRVVHETSERDIQARQVMDALTGLAAQIMRLAAGAGSISRMGRTLSDLNEALAAMPDGAVLLFDDEAGEALDFTSSNADAVDRSFEEIARQSLRLVASRYQRLRAQTSIAKRSLLDAISSLERAREDDRMDFSTIRSR